MELPVSPLPKFSRTKRPLAHSRFPQKIPIIKNQSENWNARPSSRGARLQLKKKEERREGKEEEEEEEERALLLKRKGEGGMKERSTLNPWAPLFRAMNFKFWL